MDMHEDFMRRQIESVASEAARQRVADYLSSTCWPGGGWDRTLPAALAWVSTWRPERFAIDLVACGCSTGRCRVCN
jgi:hypothetical protein